MKKTIVAFMALAGMVSATETVTYTLSTSLPSENYNAYDAFGFYLNMSQHIKNSVSGQEYELTETITLNSFKLEWAHGNGNKDNNFAFIVIDDSNNVLGYSSSAVVQNDGTGEFSFISADGESPLTLSADTTYRYLSVNSDVINNISTGYTYSAAEGDCSIDNNTITGGLVKINGRAYADATNAYSDALFINSSDGLTSNKVGSGGGYNLHVRPHTISVTTVVPEPTTATLSLLALAGLAARRRRK